MKKLILSLIAVAVGTLSSFAQSDLVATLSHGSSLSTFSGMDALAQAYAAAAEGDVITLSPGVFNAVNIEKAITVRGAGMQPMESNGYVVTQIIGAMTITVPDNASSVLSLEGINPLTGVNIYGNNLAPINVMKCRFEDNVEGYGISMNAVSCIFVTRLGATSIKGSNKYNTTLNCYNCVITNATAGGIRESYLAKKGFQTIFQGADGFPWKACERQKRFASSNLALSASKRLIFNRLQSQKHFFVRH